MQPGTQAQVSQGPEGQTIMQGKYRDFEFKVSTTYDGRHDRWFFHVFVQDENGGMARISETPTQWSSGSKSSALEQGLELAKQRIDRPVGGFQRAVNADISPR